MDHIWLIAYYLIDFGNKKKYNKQFMDESLLLIDPSMFKCSLVNEY